MIRTGLILEPLAFWVATSPDREALIMDDRVVTYRELGVWTDAIAFRLQRLGVTAGDVVAVTGANSLEWIAAALGALKAGAVVAPFNHRAVYSEVAYLIDLVAPTVIVADADRAALLAPLAVERKFMLADMLEIAVPSAGESYVPPVVSANDPAMLVFTSGTSGYPKAVIHTHATILASRFERQMIEPCYQAGMRQLFVFSLYALPGTISGFLSTCIHGGSFVMEAAFDPARALELLVKHKITAFQGVPLLFDQISRQPGFEEADLSSLASAQVGGALIPAPLLERWRAKGVLLRQLYGMTEVCGGATVSTDFEARDGRDTCGRGGVFTKLRIVDRDGVDCPANVAGDVLVKGPACTPGYWGNRAATEELYSGEWLKTGDVGEFDDDGYFRFIDRAKDLIISGGINISPAEVERVVGDVPGVIEVAVIPARDEKFGETPAALVYAREPFDVQACISHCNEHLTDYKVPRFVVPLDKPLPRMTSGKVDKALLKRDFADIPARFAKVR